MPAKRAGSGAAQDYIQVESQPRVHKSGTFTVHVVGCHGFTTLLLRQPSCFSGGGATYCYEEGSQFIPEIFRASRGQEIRNSKFSFILIEILQQAIVLSSSKLYSCIV